MTAAKPRLSVVLGTYNRRPFLEAAIASIRASVISLPFEIIVVDGGSTDGTLEWLTAQKDVLTIVQHNRVIVDGKPVRKRSWGYFMNLAFKAAEGEIICMISDDSVVHPDTLREGIMRYDELVQAGRRLGGVAFYWRSWPHEQAYRVGQTFADKTFVNHGLFNRAALAEVGFLDEDRYQFYCADGDACLRLWQAGYEIESAPRALLEHCEKASPDLRASNYELVEQDVAAYVARWDGVYVDRTAVYEGRWNTLDGVDPREAAHLFPPEAR